MRVSRVNKIMNFEKILLVKKMNNFDFQVIRFVTSEEINAWLNEIERIVKTKLLKLE